MKSSLKILLISLFACASCHKNEPAATPVPAKTVTPTPKKTADPSPVFSKKDFALVYSYAEGDSNQILGINILDQKTIKFHLVTQTLPCDTAYWGIAVNRYPNSDGETDTDEEGGYFVDEYFKDEKTYTIGIRLASDLSKVQIKYIQKDSLDTDCLPITGQIMPRSK